MLRHEDKFIISLSAAEELRHRLRAVLRPDVHTGPDGRYFIRSLYFDDAALSAYHDKLAGVPERSKLRLRWYNCDDSYILFEKKEKFSGMTRKSAVRLTRVQAEAMEQGDLSFCRGTQDPLLQEFYMRAVTGLLRPWAAVDYDRIPFVGVPGNVRLTLDLGVRTTPNSLSLFGSGTSSLPVLSPGTAVLEVKYNDFLPSHIIAAIENIPKARMAVSKYCLCLAALHSY